MLKIFYILMGLLFIFSTASHAAEKSAIDCTTCQLYKHARLRAPRHTTLPLECINFTLTEQGGRVTLRIFKGERIILEDAKQVPAREGQFCYPRARLGEFDTVFLCSEHSVTLQDDEILPILSRPSQSPRAYACLRGIAGCGGTDHVSIPAAQLHQ